MSLRWAESERLLADRPVERGAIEKLDAYLAERNTDDRLHPRHLARALDLREGQVSALLEAYAALNVVTALDVVECERCEFLSLTDEAEPGGDCEGCGRELHGQEIVVYRLLASWAPVDPEPST
jgi:hypothetical protein